MTTWEYASLAGFQVPESPTQWLLRVVWTEYGAGSPVGEVTWETAIKAEDTSDEALVIRMAHQGAVAEGLTKAGQEGWELVTVEQEPVSTAPALKMWFKRPLDVQH